PGAAGAEPLGAVDRLMTSILTYHRVGDFENPTVRRGLHCSIAHFRRHLQTLRRFGFTVATLEDAVSRVRARSAGPSRAVVLTFDDGYGDFREHALPLLQEFAYPVTLFVVTGRLGGVADWLAPPYVPPALLDVAALREIAASGVEIGSHTRTHRRLPEL